MLALGRLLAVLVLCFPALAAASEAVVSDRVTARLVAAAETVAPGDTVRVGLHLQIAPGWHTYWRNPGDSGAPTTLDWRLPPDVEAGPILWPLPEAIPYGPLMNYGYHDEVLHIVELTVPADWPVGRPLPLEADGVWLVCADICIPESGTLTSNLETGPATVENPATLGLFERFGARLPQPSPFVLAAGTEPLRLVVEGTFDPALLDTARFFPDAAGQLAHAEPQRLEVRDGGLVLTLPVGRAPPQGSLEGLLVLSERFGPRTFEQALVVDVPITASLPDWAAPARAAFGGLGLLTALGLALAGGLLLNLMPCVFPVLSMKAMGLVELAGRDRSTVRRHGLFYLAGVLVMFLAVAAALIGLRAAGAQVGWGFQLQSPLVVAALAYVLFVVGLNLSGLFTIGLVPNVGADAAARRDGLGAFATGLLAVVVATPCTAPFMATALGFALIQPPLITLAVFLALGIGLALPFLLVSLLPDLANKLPRPGPWMERLRQGLAFPMYASAAWLVWVLALQAGPNAVLAVLVGAVLLAFALWLVSPAGGRTSLATRLVGGVMALAALALLLIPATSGGVRPATAASTGLAAGEPFAPERLETALARGDAVFVHLTAAWCITCQVNEQVALSGEAFRLLLEQTEMTYLVGDWTNRDPVIAAYLRRFDHPGVPLYVVYEAETGTARILPQVLTPGIVRHALRAAARG